MLQFKCGSTLNHATAQTHHKLAQQAAFHRHSIGARLLKGCLEFTRGRREGFQRATLEPSFPASHTMRVGGCDLRRRRPRASLTRRSLGLHCPLSAVLVFDVCGCHGSLGRRAEEEANVCTRQVLFYMTKHFDKVYYAGFDFNTRSHDHYFETKLKNMTCHNMADEARVIQVRQCIHIHIHTRSETWTLSGWCLCPWTLPLPGSSVRHPPSTTARLRRIPSRPPTAPYAPHNMLH